MTCIEGLFVLLGECLIVGEGSVLGSGKLTASQGDPKDTGVGWSRLFSYAAVAVAVISRHIWHLCAVSRR
jgi:hypothetical protein